VNDNTQSRWARESLTLALVNLSDLLLASFPLFINILDSLVASSFLVFSALALELFIKGLCVLSDHLIDVPIVLLWRKSSVDLGVRTGDPSISAVSHDAGLVLAALPECLVSSNGFTLMLGEVEADNLAVLLGPE